MTEASSSAAMPAVERTPSPIAPGYTTTVAGAPDVEVEILDDSDSAYVEDIESSYTASLTSTIKNHTYENGRRYHAYQSSSGTGYFAPNDDAENDRLDMHHHLATLLINGKLVTAPIGKNPQRILDLGTGTGIWAIDIGDEYPSAEVIGVDLSPTQPRMVPPNVKFEVDDIEKQWTHSQPFDYIHSRFMAASIADWPNYVKQIYKHTKPGGYAELKDWDLTIRSGDNSLPQDHPVNRYHDMLYQAITIVGRSYAPGPSLKTWAEDAGFENVEETIEAIPLGLWPKEKRYKEIGAWNLLCLVEGLESVSLRLFTDVLGMTKEEVTVFLTTVRDGLKDKKIHAQYTYYVVTARKPLDTSTSAAEGAAN